jgi:hypothetical protein
MFSSVSQLKILKFDDVPCGVCSDSLSILVGQAARMNIMCNSFWHLLLIRYILGIHGVYKIESLFVSLRLKKGLKQSFHLLIFLLLFRR